MQPMTYDMTCKLFKLWTFLEKGFISYSYQMEQTLPLADTISRVG